jgi:hypothetical protein
MPAGITTMSPGLISVSVPPRIVPPRHSPGEDDRSPSTVPPYNSRARPRCTTKMSVNASWRSWTPEVSRRLIMSDNPSHLEIWIALDAPAGRESASVASRLVERICTAFDMGGVCAAAPEAAQTESVATTRASAARMECSEAGEWRARAICRPSRRRATRQHDAQGSLRTRRSEQDTSLPVRSRTSTRFCGVKRMVNRDGVARAPVRRENLAFA